MSGSMVMHKGAKVVPVEVIAALPAPESLGRFHRPIPHIELIEGVRKEAAARDLGIAREQFAIDPKGDRLFALFDFESKQAEAERAISLALRNSTQQSLAAQGVAGSHVFICDNLSLKGETFLFARKNTINAKVIDMVRDGFDKFVPAAIELEARLQDLQTKLLSKSGAEAAIYRAFTKYEVAAIRYLPQVHEAYFEKGTGTVEGATGEYPEVGPNVYGLANAFTRVFKGLAPTPKFEATRRLGAMLGM